MPHPALMSKALYAVPTLPDMLNEVGVAPGTSGYEVLRAKHKTDVHVATPTIRTVQKMLIHGDLVKWSMCDGIVRLLNVARNAMSMPLLDATCIEEHEFYLLDLSQALDSIRQKHGVNRTEARIKISEKADRPISLVRALEKKYRTDSARCEAIRDAVSQLWGIKISISNEPFLVRRGVKKRLIKAVPPIDRGNFAKFSDIE